MGTLELKDWLGTSYFIGVTHIRLIIKDIFFSYDCINFLDTFLE